MKEINKEIYKERNNKVAEALKGISKEINNLAAPERILLIDYLKEEFSFDVSNLETSINDLLINSNYISPEIIKRLRKDCNITATEFSEIINVTRATVSYWENNHKSIKLKHKRRIYSLFKETIDSYIKPKKY